MEGQNHASAPTAHPAQKPQVPHFHQQPGSHQQPMMFQTMEEPSSAQKVSTIGSLGGAASSAINTQTKLPSTTTTKGSQVLSQIKQSPGMVAYSQNSAVLQQSSNGDQYIPSVSGPLTNALVTQSTVTSGKPVQGIRTKIGRQGNAVLVNHQMRYKKKASPLGPDQIETSQFNTIAGTDEVPPSAIGVRAKKHQYVSLNATTNLVNSSLEGPPGQASTIVQSSN